MHGETRSRKRGVIRFTFKVGKEHFLHSEDPPPKRQKTNSEAVPLKEVKYGTRSSYLFVWLVGWLVGWLVVGKFVELRGRGPP